MIVGIPKEIKPNEGRVAMAPMGVLELCKRGHEVVIEEAAGSASGFEDDEYRSAGAEVAAEARAIWERAGMIVKVKEPLAQEFKLIREGQTIFTYFHFAVSRDLTERIMASGAVAVAYETVQKADGSLPLLIPMSEVAGRMSVQEGAKYLERAQGGRGVLLSGIPGVLPAQVLILGGGVVGVNAAKIAAGMGADVTIMDISLPRLRYLDDIMPPNVNTLMCNESNIRACLPRVDMVIGAVLIPGSKTPGIVTRDMLRLMKKGCVVVDVCVDQGGSFETSKPTTHEDPIYVVDGVVHYCVANMPGAVPYTSTIGLTNATLPYAIELADKGWRRACRENQELGRGLSIAHGAITHEKVASAFGLPYVPVAELVAEGEFQENSG